MSRRSQIKLDDTEIDDFLNEQRLAGGYHQRRARLAPFDAPLVLAQGP